MAGKVYLVGAGPGDEGLMTVKGACLLQKADAVVYDRLVGPGVIAQIPEAAERIGVGKSPGEHSIPQEEINGLLLEKALAGKLVVRLKGGDPFLFGRGGEELEFLERNGIPFEVVPGVTSAIGGAAYAGIPVTHREFSSSVHIISGHGKGGPPAAMDYGALARLANQNGTLVFVMSVGVIGRIAEGLMAAGMDGGTPAAAVENAATPLQRSFICTLADIARVAENNAIQPPALFIIGAVCLLGRRFDWFGKLPLFGCRVLVTRPERSAGSLCERLRELGALVTPYPCIEIRALPVDIDFDEYDLLIFTSAAGVNAVFEPFFRERDLRRMTGKFFIAVGPRTRAELLKYGIRADFTPSVYNGESLAKELLTEFLNGGRPPGQIRAGLFRARDGAAGIKETLERGGLSVRDIAVYETAYVRQAAIGVNEFDFVTFTSAGCVAGFCRANAGAELSGVNAVCIGPGTAAAAENAGMRAMTADEASIESMIDRILEARNGTGAVQGKRDR